MPKSEDVANMFMSGGRGDDTGSPMSADVDVCDVRHMKSVMGFDASGSAKVVPDGVCYNPCSEDKRVPDWYKAGMDCDSEGK